jgi:hypothetical protein
MKRESTPVLSRWATDRARVAVLPTDVAAVDRHADADEGAGDTALVGA